MGDAGAQQRCQNAVPKNREDYKEQKDDEQPKSKRSGGEKPVYEDPEKADQCWDSEKRDEKHSLDI